MKKNRKVFLIKLLVIVLIGGAIYYFGHMQLEDQISALRSERISLINESEDFSEILDRLSMLNSRIPIFESLIADIAEEYTRDFEQAEYILYLKSFLDDSNIILESFIYEDPRVLPIFASRENPVDASREVQDVMGYNSYRLTFRATNEQLLEFLSLTEESGRGFASSVAVISRVADDGEILNVNMELRFFYLADMAEFTLDYDFSQILDNNLFNEERVSVFQ